MNSANQDTEEHGRAVLSPAAARRFVLAGDAILTVENPRSGNRFTYRIRAAKPRDGQAGGWFVAALVGPENTRDYSYIGMIFAPDQRFALTKGSKLAADAPSVRAFAWTWERLNRVHRDPLLARDALGPVRIWHVGRCGRCGRDLTVPSSIAEGLGPECASKVAA